MINLLSIKGAIFIFSFLFVFQDAYQPLESDFKVSGTSTMHDWTIVSDKLSGSATFKAKGNVLEEVSDLKFSIPAESLKSGKRPMDNNTYKALKTKENPNIIFELKNVQQLTQRNGKAFIRANGDLTIAGQTRLVVLNVTAEVINQEVVFTGSHKLKMTDFNVTPPAFMAGTIKTGDEVTINFNLSFNKDNSIKTNK
ncbi:MAG: YceI family protein [Bacteroidetes bacterium]|nr:YceI family protein [Bacteroidota bacterium]